VRLRTTAAVAAALSALLLPAAAQGHITLQPDEDVPAGGFTRLDVRVPNERDKAGTTKVSVQFPDGFFFVSNEPLQGWTAKVRREKVAQPVEIEGEKITEQVTRVTFTAKGGARIGPGQFRDFGLSARVPEKPGTLTFKAIQTYENGEVVRWIGPPDSEEPAPQVKTVASTGEHGGAEETAAAPTGTTAGGGEEEDSETLAIIALIAAGVALLAALVAMLRGRRRA
jgi:uncharacterized protein YcnI